MSPGIRLVYFLLIVAGLLNVSLGIHELSQVPSGNIQGFAMVGTGMLILAWDLANPPRPLADIDENSIRAKISQSLDPFVQALLNQPALLIVYLIVRESRQLKEFVGPIAIPQLGGEVYLYIYEPH